MVIIHKRRLFVTDLGYCPTLMHVPVYTYVNVCDHTHTCTCMYVQMYPFCVPTWAHRTMGTLVLMYLCTHVLFVFICTHMYVYVRTNVSISCTNMDSRDNGHACSHVSVYTCVVCVHTHVGHVQLHLYGFR